MNVIPVTLELEVGTARLEPLTRAHARDLLDAGSDPEIWRYSLSAQPLTLAEAESHVDAALAAPDECPFAIVHRAEGRAIGSTRYLDIQPRHRAVEIGSTWIGARWQRTSINTECKLLLMRHAFVVLGCVRVQLKADTRNQRSCAAMERIGARYEGTLRKHRILRDGFIRDTAYYSVIAQEWPAVERRLVARLGDGPGTAG